MIEYPKIETLYERDSVTHKVKPGEFKNTTYKLLKEWHFTEKIDGTNIRLSWTPRAEIPSNKFVIGGRTENAQLHVDLIKFIYGLNLQPKFEEVFPDCDVIVFGEGYGAGIQKGGAYSYAKRFAAFDVFVDEKWWLNWDGVKSVAHKLGLDVVPELGFMDIVAATVMVRDGFPSQLGDREPAEGLVGKPRETLFDKKHHRLILKLKTKDFDHGLG